MRTLESTETEAEHFMSVPDRSLQQRMDALHEANKIRTKRATLKRDIKVGRTDVLDCILDPPEYLQTIAWRRECHSIRRPPKSRPALLFQERL
jgi:hypothetical protein